MKHSRLLIGVALVIFIVLWVSSFLKNNGPPVPAIVLFPSPTALPTPTPDPLAPFRILLLGYAGGDHEGSLLTDTMIVAHIEPRMDRVAFISIPRDLQVPLTITEATTGYYKINAAYAFGTDHSNYPDKPSRFMTPHGGGLMAGETVTLVTGLPTRWYIAINFDGFTRAINRLGGVDIQVPQSFEDPFFPIKGMEKDTCGTSEDDMKLRTATLSGEPLAQTFACRYETLKFEKGLVHIDGESALKFVRSRHSPTDGSDYARATRQRALLTALQKKVLTLSFLPKAVGFVKELAGGIATNIDMGELSKLTGEISGANKYKIRSLALTEDNILVASRSADGAYVSVPRGGNDAWESVAQFVQNELNATTSGLKK